MRNVIKIVVSTGFLSGLMSTTQATMENLTDYTDLNIGTVGGAYLNPYPEAEEPGYEMPNFSWDIVPRWIPFNLNWWYPDDWYIEAIAEYDMVMFEKANRQGFVYIEDALEDCAARVKALNPDIKTMFYWNATLTWGGYRANENGLLENYDDWTTPVEWSTYMTWFNLYLPEVRDWWVESALSYLEVPNIDGLFIDNAFGSDYQPAFDENLMPTGPFVEMLHTLEMLVPDDQFVMANCLRNFGANGNRDSMRFLDASYLESWGASKVGQESADAVAVTIQLMREASSRGKFTNFRGDAPKEGTVENYEEGVYFPLAVFLMGAEEYSYFCYTQWHAGFEQWIWDTSWLDIFYQPLGEPLGPPVKDGYVYSRSFRYLDVTVNVETEETTYDWKDPVEVDTNLIANITYPVSGVCLDPGASVTIKANARDDDATIDKVEFYWGDSKLEIGRASCRERVCMFV